VIDEISATGQALLSLTGMAAETHRCSRWNLGNWSIKKRVRSTLWVVAARPHFSGIEAERLRLDQFVDIEMRETRAAKAFHIARHHSGRLQLRELLKRQPWIPLCKCPHSTQSGCGSRLRHCGHYSRGTLEDQRDKARFWGPSRASPKLLPVLRLKVRGELPVQRLKARENAAGSENPTRYAVSFTDARLPLR
jgi:hypothetical protein